MKLRSLILAMAVLWFSGISVLSRSGPTWAAEGLFLVDKHKNRGTDCSGCHRESPVKQDVPMAVCLGCHGDYRKVAAKTNKLDPNPHDSHLGEVDCAKCHHAHKPSVNACNECHQFDMKVP
jgi:fumarate reductase flavoprotein subunit